MDIKIALAGNPNSGKTTMFNDLTGSSQRVGNWPGVTVERKEGFLKGSKSIIVQDLPGIYSLSPYTLEEVLSRDYLLEESPDVILNIADATNIERNLYLTTQLLEIGRPVVVALNMMDIVRKNGDKIDTQALSASLGCPVVETSALKNEGSEAAARAATEAALKFKKGDEPKLPPVFGGSTEHAIAHIEDIISPLVKSEQLRWHAIKLFERDKKAVEKLGLSHSMAQEIESLISECESYADDDSESIIINERYNYIGALMEKCVVKGKRDGQLSTSEKIDRIVTNRWLALPIFAAIMFIVYFVSVTTVGTLASNFTGEVLFGRWIIPFLEGWFVKIGAAGWISGLVVNGIVSGVGSVLSFVPQMLVLFIFLSILEEIGYMARIAFVMDRVFRKFGLSGKSFIPMLIGTGCTVPGIMASRTIENQRDRRMTIITTPFIPCGAKMPIVGMFAGAIFGGAWWVAPSAYFMGIAAVIISGLILKKTKMFSGEPSPFVMELPPYHAPILSGVLRSSWERGWSFIKRAGTVILLASIIIWFLSGYGFANGAFGAVDMDKSILALIGGFIAPIFGPLGFGIWPAAVATVMGLLAKEEVVGVFGVLFGVSGSLAGLAGEGAAAGLAPFAQYFTPAAAFSFLIFNLLCAPCFAAMGAIRKEMNSGKWTAFAIAYLCVFAYAFSLVFYQLALLFSGGGFGVGTAAAILVLAFVIYMIVRPEYSKKQAGIAQKGKNIQ